MTQQASCHCKPDEEWDMHTGMAKPGTVLLLDPAPAHSQWVFHQTLPYLALLIVLQVHSSASPALEVSKDRFQAEVPLGPGNPRNESNWVTPESQAMTTSQHTNNA